MGKPVLDTVKGESPLFEAGSSAEPFTYTPAKKVRALLIGVEAWGANVTPISAMTVNGSATTEEESRIGASPFPYSELRFIELEEEQSGPFTISPTKNKNANVRCEVIGIRSGSKVEVLEVKGSSGTGTSRFVGSQTWPAGGALGVFVITLGPTLPTSRSGTLLLQRDEGENSWDVQTNERESTSANESWTWSGSVPAAAVGVLLTGSTPSESKTVEFKAPLSSGSSLAAKLERIRELRAALSSSSSLSAYLTRIRLIQAALSSASQLDAKLETASGRKTVEFRSTLQSATSVAAKLTATRLLRAALSSASLLSAHLEVEGEPVPIRLDQRGPLELGIEIETAEGAFFSLDADALKASNVPTAMSFSTQRGDGFGTATFTLNREIFRDYPDLNLMDTVRFVGRQGDIAYEGLIQSFPRTNDPQQQISVQCVGWMTSLKWRPMTALIIDSRLGGWTEPSNERKVVLHEANTRLDASVSAGWKYEGEAQPGVIMDFGGVTPAEGFQDRGEQYFFAGGEEIGKLLYHYMRLSGGGAATWTTQASLLANDHDGAAIVNGPNHEGNTNSSSFETVEATGGQKFARMFSDKAFSSAAQLGALDNWSNPKVIGTHGLTLRGTWPEVGFSISEAIRYLVERYAPKLIWAGEENQFILMQAAWHDNAALPYDAIQTLNNLTLWELNVWEGRELHFEPADLTKADWQIRTDDPGVSVQFQGDSIENFANGVVVTYSDFFGHTYTLYPDSHPELRDENENNAATRHGEDLWIGYTIPWQCLEAEALQFGRAYLADTNRPKRPGTFTVQGYIRDGAGHWQQAWKVRNSQTLSIMDDLYEGEPRLITATSYDEETATLSITVDAPPMRFEAIVARQQQALEARNLTSA